MVPRTSEDFLLVSRSEDFLLVSVVLVVASTSDDLLLDFLQDFLVDFLVDFLLDFLMDWRSENRIPCCSIWMDVLTNIHIGKWSKYYQIRTLRSGV